MTTRKTVTVAILFADIAKSSHMYETLGDKIARNFIGKCVSTMANVTELHNGTVIKTIGDEVMCTFPTAADAVKAAKAMHMELEEITVDEKPECAPPNIYVGIHLGPVISEGGDVFGEAVNVAAQMVQLANQRQIFTTEETVAALAPEFKSSVRWIDKQTIKGKKGKIKIYEVIWEGQDVTVMLDENLMKSMDLRTRLELEYQGQTFEVGELRPNITLGRQSHNDVVVNDNHVSRTHARIESRSGKFILIDLSTNGTYALMQGKKSVTLKGDEVQLLGNGIIALGQEVDADSSDMIHFAIKF